MNIVNKMVVNHNVYNFIDSSITTVLNHNRSIVADKKYWLFYFIKDNYIANMQYLNTVNVDQDVFGFIPVWRNTRNSIEAFYDLINLSFVEGYTSVLEFCDAKGENKHSLKINLEDRFKKYLYKGSFTILSKQKIAMEYAGWGGSSLLSDISERSNKYVHPSVFVKVFQIHELARKEEIIKDLLKTNIFILTQAYHILIRLYHNNIQPILSCINCYQRNCANCYQNICQDYNRLVEGPLLININQNTIPYSFQ